MHLNKLSTAALMRLSLLAALNLLLVRSLGLGIVLHPLFFLIIVTINLGLYALMVYSDTLNRTLIAMMTGGLAGVLAVIAYNGLGPSAFANGGPYWDLGYQLQGLINEAVEKFPQANFPAPSNQFWLAYHTEVAYTLVDVMGLGLILASGVLARFLHARSRCRYKPESAPIDSGAASPL